ncbi:collagen alpha-4(VI) chain-like, partial [Sardina pilchardus]|uniref:collagen alpha-4(VI) chain-like n=2 Tax=Sardina pilchardus TaxID=27697 RepID=UPI002E1687D7
DIVFLVDGSGSIGTENFQRVREFLHGLVDGFDVAPDRVRIGMVQYSDTQRTEFSLNTHQNKTDVLEYIDKLPYMGGGTMTGLGLDFILKNQFVESAGSRAKEKVPQIAVVITDGQSSDNVGPSAENLKKQNITHEIVQEVCTDAKGPKPTEPSTDEKQLKEIASAPPDQHVFSVTDFTSLQNITHEIVQEVCTDAKGPKPTEPSTVCSDETVADIVFLVDSSGSIGSKNFQRVREFLHSVVYRFNVAPDRVRIGMVQYNGTQRTEFSLNTHQNKTDILEYIDKMPYMRGCTMTGLGLKFILEKLFVESAGSRAKEKVPQIAVVITDGKSEDNVEPFAENLKKQGITIYTIGVKNADEKQLKEIASAPPDQHVFSVSDFTALQGIYQKIVQMLCSNMRA